MGEVPAMGRGAACAPTGAAHWTRRRAIRIFAAAVGLPLMIATVRATAPAPQMFRWQGEVLDAVAELTLVHTDAAFAHRTLRKIEREIARYERIFSLYRPDSEIARLNAAERSLLAQHLPNAQLIMYPDSSHGAQSQHAEIFLEHAKLFLR